MSVPLVINGVTYIYPELNDSPPLVEWGVTATDWATAVTQGMLQKAGGNFTLTADVNFGATYGLLAAYFSSRVTPVAQSGLVRLDNANWMAWRNIGNTADLKLAVNASNQLTFDGSVLALGSGDVAGPASSTDNAVARYDSTTGKIIQNSVFIIDDSGNVTGAANITATGALLSGLTASKVVVTDGSKNLTSSSVSSSELKPITNFGAIAWTPTATWSANQTMTGVFRRVGDVGQFRVQILLSGTPTNANLAINLPAGHTIDTSKLLGTNNGIPLGNCVIKDASGSPDFIWSPVVYSTTTAVEIDGVAVVGAYAIFRQVNLTSPITFTTGDALYIYFEVPIVEYA